MTPLLPFRSLAVKLGVVLFVVVTTAIGIVYLALIPRLETRLVDAKIGELRDAAPSVERAISRTDYFYNDVADDFAATLDARVVVFDQAGSGLLDVGDSSPRAAHIEGDPIARETAESGYIASGRAKRNGRSFAEVAFPAAGHKVVLLSASLNDVLANVRLVRRSLILAGVLALSFSLLAGSLAAWRLTRRLRALEGAAERISGGDFAEPVVDHGQDEVGQLARAFDRMRLRLAHLEDARREFIANASHELRTPIFSLAGFLELVTDDELDEATRRDFLAEMRAQVERLTKLASELLDLSRLDAGHLSVEAAELDLGLVARTLVDECTPLAEQDGHRIGLEDGEPVWAVGDEQRVLQVGRALVENALRHTPGGTPVSVTAEQENGRAKLVVRDEGPGVSPDDRDHLFERFYRGESVHASGSGLGLAIASELAQRMGGSITFDSTPGETVFRLDLPSAEPSGGDGGAFSHEIEAAEGKKGARAPVL